MDKPRRKRRQLGSLLPSKGDDYHQEQIDALHRDLIDLQPLRELRTLKEWEAAKEVLERQVEINSDAIIGFAFDPVKNEKNILRCWAVIYAYEHLFDIIEQTEEDAQAKTQSIEERLEIMERISRTPRASEVERTL